LLVAPTSLKKKKLKKEIIIENGSRNKNIVTGLRKEKGPLYI